MAIATEMSIGTSNKVTVDYQSQEVSISITFELERTDTDLQALVAEKAAEVERAHSSVWRRIRELRTQQKATEAGTTDDTGAEQAQPSEADGEPTPKPCEGAKRHRLRSARRTAKGEATIAADNGVAGPERAEATEGGESQLPGPNGASASLAQQRAILSLANRAGMDDQSLTTLLEEIAGRRAVEQLTRQEAARLLVDLQRRDKTAAFRAA